MNSESKLYDSFEAAGIFGINQNANQQKTHCPQCHDDRRNKRDKSLFVSPSKGLWKCFHCDWTGGLKDPNFKPNYKQDFIPQKKRTYTPPPPKPAKPTIGPEMTKWFDGRGVTIETLNNFQIFETESQGYKWINFPYYRDKQLVNVKKRNGKKDFRLSANAELIFFNLDSVFGSKEIIITEGEIDCMTVVQAGFESVVSVPNGAQKGNAKMEYLDNCFEYFQDAEKFILAVDNDEAGQILAEELCRRLGREKCHLVDYPNGCKDINEVLVKYGNEFVVSTIKGAKQHPIAGINRPNEYVDEVIGYHLNGFPSGDKVGYKDFDNLMSFRPGELTVITGIPNSGKSAWLDQVLVRLSSRCGWKHGILSREQWPHSIHMTKLVQIFSGKGLRSKEMNKDIIRSSMDFLNDHLFLFGIDDLTIDGILEKAKQLVLRHGIKSLVIDPWNTLDHDMQGTNETEYIRKTLKKVVDFKDRYSVHVFVIAHPTKVSTDAMGKFLAPTLYSIAGSAHWYNMMDNGIIIYRNVGTRAEKTGDLGDSVSAMVKKVRNFFIGQQGTCSFDYNYNNGNYTEEGFSFENEFDLWKYRNKPKDGEFFEPTTVPETPLTDIKKLPIGSTSFDYKMTEEDPPF